MHEMIDSNKINEIKKEIKELQKYKAKAEKVLDKMKMKSEGKITKKIEDEGVEEEGMVDEVNLDEYTDDPAAGPQLEEETEQVYEMLLMQKRAGIISETEYKAKLEEAKKKASAGLTKKQKSAISKKAHAGKDIGGKGKNFEKVAKSAGGGEKGEKIAAAAMWKGEAKKAKGLKEEVQALFEDEMLNEVVVAWTREMDEKLKNGGFTIKMGYSGDKTVGVISKDDSRILGYYASDPNSENYPISKNNPLYGKPIITSLSDDNELAKILK